MHHVGENPSSHPHLRILPLIKYPRSAVLIGQTCQDRSTSGSHMLVSIVSLTFGLVDNAESSPRATVLGCFTKEREEPSPTQGK